MAISGSLNFLSASMHGGYMVTATRVRYFGASEAEISADAARSAFIPVDFVGLNTLIYEPITGSENYLGFALGDPVGEGVATDSNHITYFNYNFIAQVTDETPPRLGTPVGLNSILLNRNGPYGHPMWKQWRGHNHPVARFLRRNNKVSIDTNNPIPTMLENKSSQLGWTNLGIQFNEKLASQKHNRTLGIDKFADFEIESNIDSAHNLNITYTEGTNLKQFYEPVVISKYKPFTYTIPVGSRTGIARQTLMNQMTFFTNPEMNDRLRIASGDPLTGSALGMQPFRKLKHQYYSLAAAAKDVGASNFIYSERMYPRSINAYRGYKVKRPSYDESGDVTFASVISQPRNSKEYDKKPGQRRSFWRTLQGGGETTSSSDGTTRMRTDGSARSSISGENKLWGIVYEDTGYRKNSFGGDSALYASNNMRNGYYTRQLLSSSSPCYTTPWNRDVTFLVNGVVVNQHYVLTGALGTSGPDMLGVQPKSGFAQLESYQPYEISALSMWPLDPRQDIYDSPVYLTSSIGGKGLQIGLTPHRAGYPLTNTSSYLDSTVLNAITASITNLKTGSAGELVYSTKPTIFFYRTGTEETSCATATITITDLTELNNGDKVNLIATDATSHDFTVGSVAGGGTWIAETDNDTTAANLGAQINANVKFSTFTFGPVVTITQASPGPGGNTTITLTDSSTAGMSKTDFIDGLKLDGYGMGKASIQYNRHTFPYNTPFYATNKIRGIDPFHNSYEDFFEILEYVGKDYTIVPEYNLSDHIEAYYDFMLKKSTLETFNDNIYSVQEHSIDSIQTVNLFLPRTYMENVTLPTLAHKNDFLRTAGAVMTSSATREFTGDHANPATTEECTLYKYLDVSDPEGDDSLSAVTETGSYGSKKHDYGTINESNYHHWAQNRASVKYAALFSETDTFKAFSNLCSLGNASAGGVFNNGPTTIPNGIKFKCHALKKMRIKDGFYPVTRTVQIAKNFDEAFLAHAGTNPKPTSYPQLFKGTIVGNAINTYADVTNPKGRAAMCKQAFLEPLFGPGLLYNSIKSGIAVDWPLYASPNDGSHRPPTYWCPTTYLSDPLATPCAGKQDPFHSNRVKPAVSSSFNYGGMYMMGSSRCIPAIMVDPPSHRLGFSALYDMAGGSATLTKRNIFLPSDFVDLDRTSNVSGEDYDPLQDRAPLLAGRIEAAGSPGAIYTPTFGGGGFGYNEFFHESLHNPKASMYVTSINNFLCEMMEFYLADAKQVNKATIPGVKMPVIIPGGVHTSDEHGAGFVDTFKTAELGDDDTPPTKFFMEVGLYMGTDQIMCEGPRKAGIAGTASFNETNASSFGSTMRGYIYGPPIEAVGANVADYSTGLRHSSVASVSSSIAQIGHDTIFSPLYFEETVLATSDYELYLYYNLQDPAYQAYTPPYFYGASSKILSFSPQNTTDNYKEIWDTATDAHTPMGGAFYYERYNTGSYHGDLEALCLTLPSTSSISSGSAVRMKIDASLEFSDIIKINKQIPDPDQTRYVSYIAPWWTCPVLDFSSSYAPVTDIVSITSSITGTDVGTGFLGDPIAVNSLVNNPYHDNTTGRGLWGGYGTDPYDGTAVAAVEAADGITESTSKGLYLVINNIFEESHEEYENEIGFATDIMANPWDDGSGFYTSAKPTGTVTKNSGSLTEKLGFKPDIYPIGKIASSKKVSEAIVIIPYLDQPINLVARGDTGEYISGYNIQSLMEGSYGSDPTVAPTSNLISGFPGGEIYSTREIIPGKHFLPINRALYNNMLSLFSTAKYIPRSKRGSMASSINKNIYGAETVPIAEGNLAAAMKTDVGKMIVKLMGDLEGFTNAVNPDISGINYNKTHNLGLQLPPEFDFIHDLSVSPFQMIVLPFEHIFNKQDLLDMYQGIMPRIARHFEKRITEQAINPIQDTPNITVLNEAGTGFASATQPSWVPYIPIGGISEDASYYKEAYNAAVEAAWAEAQNKLVGEMYIHGQEWTKENFLSLLSDYQNFDPYTGGSIAAQYHALYDAWTKLGMRDEQQIVVDGGVWYHDVGPGEIPTHSTGLFELAWTWQPSPGSTHGGKWVPFAGMEETFTDKGQASYNELTKDIGLLEEINATFQAALADIAAYQGTGGAGTIEKKYLDNLGLENFLCPPLKSGAGLTNSVFFNEFIDINNSTFPEWTSKEFYENLRFMVFKVKQRGQKNYVNYRSRQIHKVLQDEFIHGSAGDSGQNHVQGEEVLENIKYGEVYGTNWPYDYFSLIETIKIDVEFKVSS